MLPFLQGLIISNKKIEGIQYSKAKKRLKTRHIQGKNKAYTQGKNKARKNKARKNKARREVLQQKREQLQGKKEAQRKRFLLSIF